MTGTLTRARLTIVAIVAGLLLAIVAAVPARADSIDDLVAVDGSLSSAVDAFAEVYSDQSTANEEVVAAAQTFQSAAETAQTDFQKVADGAEGDVARYASTFAGEAGDMATAAGGIADAFTSQDSAALSQAESDLNTALDAYQSTADEYNQYLKTAGDPAYIGWLIALIVAVVFLILTLLFALLTRKQEGLLPAKADKKGNVQQHSLKRLRWMVVLWAGVFVVGAAIPFFQVAFAQPDANGNYTYTVFWYPLAAGVILSIIGVVQYFIAAAKVRREGSAEAYDPNVPAVPVATGVPVAGAVPVTPGVPVGGAPDAPVAPPAAPVPPVAAPAAPANEVPVPPAVVDVPVPPAAAPDAVPAAPAVTTPPAPDAPSEPAVPTDAPTQEPPAEPAR